jgi:hypothetical protein
MVMALTRDEENLRLLTIFHYVVAGLAAVFSLFPLVYVGMGALMLYGKLDGPHGDPAARIMGWVFIAIGVVFFLMGMTFVVCVALAGRYLSRRKHHTYCFIMGAVDCLFMPFGTVLGVFTIIVLQKDAVRQLFGLAPLAPPVVSSS